MFIWYDTAYTVLIYKFTESIRALAAPFTAEPALNDALNKNNFTSIQHKLNVYMHSLGNRLISFMISLHPLKSSNYVPKIINYSCAQWVFWTHEVSGLPFLSIATATAFPLLAEPYVFDMAHPATLVPWPTVSTCGPPPTFIPCVYNNMLACTSIFTPHKFLCNVYSAITYTQLALPLKSGLEVSIPLHTIRSHIYYYYRLTSQQHKHLHQHLLEKLFQQN